MTKYSIEQFSQITGITKFVLRTWENRYGFLKAERTDTKIRFYTDELLVRALNSNYLLENGYKISAISKLNDDAIANKTTQLFYTDKNEAIKQLGAGGLNTIVALAIFCIFKYTI